MSNRRFYFQPKPFQQVKSIISISLPALLPQFCLDNFPSRHRKFYHRTFFLFSPSENLTIAEPRYECLTGMLCTSQTCREKPDASELVLFHAILFHVFLTQAADSLWYYYVDFQSVLRKQNKQTFVAYVCQPLKRKRRHTLFERCQSSHD